eukprot:m.64698 g.64698  ORF g.64698 m.64698 type:complete len:103 (+) comp13940_c0_seq2:41-349(+)
MSATKTEAALIMNAETAVEAACLAGRRLSAKCQQNDDSGEADVEANSDSDSDSGHETSILGDKSLMSIDVDVEVAAPVAAPVAKAVNAAAATTATAVWRRGC